MENWKEKYIKEFTGCPCRSCKVHQIRFIRQLIKQIIDGIPDDEEYHKWLGSKHLKQQLKTKWLKNNN